MAYKTILQQRAKKSVATSALKKLSPYDILISPLLTEKAYAAGDVDKKDAEKKYFFRVHDDANKNDVKEAVLAIYGIETSAVNLLWVKEKGRANRKLVRRAYKKAVVTVPAGKSLPVLDV